MKGNTNANVQTPGKLYRASINEGQTLSSEWNAKVLTTTLIDNGDPTLFTYNTNGVQVNRDGVYLITAGLGFRGGADGREMLLMVRHLRGSTTISTRNSRGLAVLYDAGVSLSTMFNAKSGDIFRVELNGTNTVVQTMFAPDESHIEVTYLG